MSWTFQLPHPGNIVQLHHEWGEFTILHTTCTDTKKHSVDKSTARMAREICPLFWMFSVMGKEPQTLAYISSPSSYSRDQPLCQQFQDHLVKIKNCNIEFTSLYFFMHATNNVINSKVVANFHNSMLKKTYRTNSSLTIV